MAFQSGGGGVGVDEGESGWLMEGMVYRQCRGEVGGCLFYQSEASGDSKHVGTCVRERLDIQKKKLK